MRRRLISLVLCVACLLPICRPMEAHAIVGVDDAIVAAYGAQLIASVLVASGVVFVVSGVANDVGKHIYDTMASSPTFKAAFSKISSLALWFVQHPTDITGAALRISDELAGPIIQCFQSRVSAGKYVLGENLPSSAVRFDSTSGVASYLKTRTFPFYIYTQQSDGSTMVRFYDFKVDSSGLYFLSDNQLLGVPLKTEWVHSDFPSGKTFYSWSSSSVYSDWGWYKYEVTIRFTDNTTTTYNPATFYDFPCTIVSSPASSVQVRADTVAYPDNTLVAAPSIPKMAESGDVVYGNTIYASNTVCVPFPTDKDGVAVVDIPVDVPVDKTTGKALTDEVPVNPDVPVTGTGVLDWLKGILKGLLDTIIGLLTNIKDGILSIPELIAKAIAAIFVPSDAAVEEVQTTIDDKLPVIADVKSILGNLTNLMEHPDQAASGLALTTVVDLSKHTSGTWGTAKVNLLDASWFIKYKSLTDDIVVGLAWLVFLWRLYGALPNIIHGMSGGGGVVDDC